jgi:hypothetical protein
LSIASNPIAVIVVARRRGDISDYWNGKIISIPSYWDRGSEQEKFEVLNAMRKIYAPDERGDIRGTTGQTPSQIGQSEGFTLLQYRHADVPDATTVIIAPLAGYSYPRLQAAGVKKEGVRRLRYEAAPTLFVCGRLRC